MKVKSEEKYEIYSFAALLVALVIGYANDSIGIGVITWIGLALPVFAAVGTRDYVKTKYEYTNYSDATTSKIIKHAIKKDMITTEHIDMAVYSACAVAYSDAYDKYKEVATKKKTMFSKLKNAAIEIKEAPTVNNHARNFNRLNSNEVAQEVNTQTAPVSAIVDSKVEKGTRVKYDLEVTASGYQLKDGAVNKELISFEESKMVETMEELNAMPSQDITAYSEQDDKIIYFFIDYGKALVEYK